MAKKHANKKPKVKPNKITPPLLKVVEGMFESLSKNLEAMEGAIRSLDGALSSYIEFKGDGDKWKKWVEKELKKQAKERAKDDTKS
tara:strand:+ start:889 stop:1146 length:258 start_codon:yes stop_codon:yes gene_type:complete